MNRDDVIDVLSVVAAATRRTVGEIDADVWQAVIGECDKQLALRGVRDHLRECPGVWIEPGHILERVRSYRRDELERESDAQREARQKALEAKVHPDIEELAERKGVPPEELKFRRRGASPYLRVKCPWCKASAGRPCVVPMTTRTPAEGWHPSRKELAEAQGFVK